MPAVVADWRRRSVHRIASGVEIRNYVRNRVPFCLRIAAAMRLDFSELGRERILLFSVQHLIRKDNDVVIAKSFPDPLAGIRRQWLCEVETGNRDAARRRQQRSDGASRISH